MAPELTDEQQRDLNLTHAFLNLLSASYQGMYVYENALGTLTHASDRDEKMAQTANVIDRINEWWAAFKRHEPLIQHHHRQGLEGESARAWRLLEVMQGRLEALMGQLLKTTHAETIQTDAYARGVRVAAFCDAAYSRQHYIQGLIAYGEIMDREDVADRWRQHLLSCQREVGEANNLYGKFSEMGDAVDAPAASFLLDVTLTHPVVVGRRVIDIRGAFGLLRGRFDYRDAGIPQDEAEGWSKIGFPPVDAAAWRAAGMSPEESLAWVEAGVPDPVGAATFAWRGVEMDVAGTWYAQGYNGRAAASWLNQGIREPSQIPREA